MLTNIFDNLLIVNFYNFFTEIIGQQLESFYIYLKMPFLFFSFFFSCVFCLFDCKLEYSNINAEAQNRNQGFNPGPITYQKQTNKKQKQK